MAAMVKASASRKELETQLVKLKLKAKRANQIAREEGEGFVRGLVTIGSGVATGYALGMAKKGKTPDEAKKATQISEIDIAPLAGGALLAAGMFKWGGSYSDMLFAAGAGSLAYYGGVRAEAAALTADESA